MKPKTIDFINKCVQKKGNIYDYSLVEYLGSKTKVKIICKEHGIFEQSPNSHLSKNYGCPKCSKFYFERKSTDDFIKESNKKHNFKYDYSLSEYVSNKTKVKIICKDHGMFEQVPNNHVSKGHGCPKCSTKYKDTNKFISESNIKHNNKYDYSLSKYENSNSVVKIICKDHGIFEQRSSSHTNGVGCPRCCDSKGEAYISSILKDNDVYYHTQHRFDDCKLDKKLVFDFYLPDHKICIEFNGKQHYESIKYFGGDEYFEIQKIRDEIKKEYCTNNNLNLIVIKFNENKEDYKNKILKCLNIY